MEQQQENREQQKQQSQQPSNVDLYKQVTELLNDPKELMAAAARHGLKLVNPSETPIQKQEAPKEDKLSFDDLTLPEEPTTADLQNVLKTAFQRMQDHSNKLVEKTLTQQREETARSEYAKKAREVQEFAKTHKHFKDVLSDMEAFHSQGRSLEEAYKKACKANGLVPEGEEAPREKPSMAFRSSPRISDEDANTDNTKPTYKSTRDAAKAKLSELMANNPELNEALSTGE